MKTLWCKNKENPSDRISHTWAPLKVPPTATANSPAPNIRKTIGPAPPAIYTSPSPFGAPLIHLKDSHTHVSYLVDTGAALSLLSAFFFRSGYSQCQWLDQGVTKRCRLSLLTNSTLVLRVQMRGEGGSCGFSANEHSCKHHVTWSPNELWRSTSIFNLWARLFPLGILLKKQLKFGNHCFTHSFLQAKVAQPILGRAGSQPMSTYSCAPGAQIIFRDQTPYSTCGSYPSDLKERTA
jgi:hypothetical protein